MSHAEELRLYSPNVSRTYPYLPSLLPHLDSGSYLFLVWISEAALDMVLLIVTLCVKQFSLLPLRIHPDDRLCHTGASVAHKTQSSVSMGDFNVLSTT